MNPSAKKDTLKRNFSIAYCNLSSIAAQTFFNLSQLEAYDRLRSYDFICLSETWLDSTTSIDYKITTYVVFLILTMLKRRRLRLL